MKVGDRVEVADVGLSGVVDSIVTDDDGREDGVVVKADNGQWIAAPVELVNKAILH